MVYIRSLLLTSLVDEAACFFGIDSDITLYYEVCFNLQTLHLRPNYTSTGEICSLVACLLECSQQRCQKVARRPASHYIMIHPGGLVNITSRLSLKLMFYMTVG